MARNKERLSQVAKEIQETYHVKTEIIVVDFTDSSATKKAVKEKRLIKNLVLCPFITLMSHVNFN